MPPVLAVVLAAVRPDPGQARSWVERELSRPEYRRSLTERLLSWVGDLWRRLTDAALGASSPSTAVWVGVLAVLVVLAVVAAARLRREPPATRAPGELLSAQDSSPDEHRARATAALAAEAYDEALVEAFRALASRSLRRGLVDARPGLTAHELALDLAAAFPDRAEDLARAAALFDVVFYGDQPAGAADARSVLDLDDALRVARPASGSGSDGPAALAVPR